MTIKRLGQEETGKGSSKRDEDDYKPLVKDYGKEYPEIYDATDVIIRGKISKSGAWCILETEEYCILMRVSSRPIKELFEQILPKLNGTKANALVSEPVKKSKFGANIAVDDEQQYWYTYDEGELSFELSEQEVKAEKKQSGLSLSMFTGSSVNEITESEVQPQPGTKRKKNTGSTKTSEEETSVK